MTLAQAKKLTVGKKIVWPEGANGCKRAVGIVQLDERYNNLFVLWPAEGDEIEGQRTYLHDAGAVKYLESFS
jgi:hypothetical protein